MVGYLDKRRMGVDLIGDEKGPAPETVDGIADPRLVVRRLFAISVTDRRSGRDVPSYRRYESALQGRRLPSAQLVVEGEKT